MAPADKRFDHCGPRRQKQLKAHLEPAAVALQPLSERERAILKLAGDGSSSHEIANKLGLTDGTVRNYLSEAIGKLGAANRVDAARIARERGWL